MRYQPFYCEENAYHLCLSSALAGRERRVVFVTGPLGACVMWHQRAAKKPGRHLFWDYHAFVVAKDPWEVWDFDTTLDAPPNHRPNKLDFAPIPVPASRYFAESFCVDRLPVELQPLFRVIDADTYARTLSSDRSHMLTQEGRYQRPPPPWPMIQKPGVAMNLHRFIDMDDPFVGERMEMSELVALISG